MPSSCVALGQNHPLARLGESLRGRPRYGLSRRRVEEGNDGSRVRELHQDHRKKLKNAHTARGACSRDGCSNNGPPTNHIPRRASLDQGRISRPCPALTVEMRCFWLLSSHSGRPPPCLRYGGDGKLFRLFSWPRESHSCDN